MIPRLWPTNSNVGKHGVPGSHRNPALSSVEKSSLRTRLPLLHPVTGLALSGRKPWRKTKREFSKLTNRLPQRMGTLGPGSKPSLFYGITMDFPNGSWPLSSGASSPTLRFIHCPL